VRDLVVHENDLVIATHGRAFWALDDVSALRHAELLADAAQKGVRARSHARAAQPHSQASSTGPR
jgi:hypothetical protein